MVLGSSLPSKFDGIDTCELPEKFIENCSWDKPMLKKNMDARKLLSMELFIMNHLMNAELT